MRYAFLTAVVSHMQGDQYPHLPGTEEDPANWDFQFYN